jgi:hypothetical protein
LNYQIEGKKMLTKKTLIAIVLVAVITVSILVPVLILTSQDNTPPTLQIISPIKTRYFSQTSQITIDLASPDSNIDTIWYRLYNETGGSWVDPTIVVYTGGCQRVLGNGGVYILYAWANDTQGRVAPVQSVTFTLYKEIIYSGNHAFSSNFTVETYQKVIFQNGAFAFTAGYLYVSGILAMYNITWTSNLYIFANSEVTGTNLTFNERVYTYGNLVASLNKVTCGSVFELRENSSITLTDVVFVSLFLTVYDSANLTVCRASNFGFDAFDRSIVDVSDSAVIQVDLYGASNVTLRDCGSLPYGFLYNNASLTLVNTSANNIYRYMSFDAGNWIMDHDVISGMGTYNNPTLTLIDAPINQLIIDLRVQGSTNLLLKDVAFSNPFNVYIYTYDSSNLTLDNTNIAYLSMYDASNVTLLNSIITSTLSLGTNGTIYLENTYCGTIVHGFSFWEGNIVGYNNTFDGANWWSFPKITMGPNVSYYNYVYAYDIFNEVNFTLTNTSKLQRLYAYHSTNVTVLFLNAPLAQIYTYDNANVTLYYSRLGYLVGYNQANITVFNSTCTTHSLSQTSFSRIIDHSHIGTLNHWDSSSYYISPDSTVDIINP